MARNFRRPRAAHPIADLNVTNLIDLGFILLVIFMIATPLIQQEQTVGVNLPTVAQAPQPKARNDERHVAVAIDARGYYLANQPEPLSLPQLRQRLAALAAEPKPPVIRVRGDAGVPFQRIAEVMTELQRAGLTRITLDTKTGS